MRQRVAADGGCPARPSTSLSCRRSTEPSTVVEYPIWSAVHGLAVLAGQRPLRDIPDATRHHLEKLTFGFIDAGLA
jgi:hypothetical protein